MHLLVLVGICLIHTIQCVFLLYMQYTANIKCLPATILGEMHGEMLNNTCMYEGFVKMKGYLWTICIQDWFDMGLE